MHDGSHSLILIIFGLNSGFINALLKTVVRDEEDGVYNYISQKIACLA